MNRKDFQELAETRLLDARALLAAGRYDAAYYLAGYAVECALKACIARLTKEYDFPPRDGAGVWSHGLEKLLDRAGLKQLFGETLKGDPELALSWDLVKDWNADARYQVHGPEKAEAMVRGVSDEQHGVLQCLRKYW